MKEKIEYLYQKYGFTKLLESCDILAFSYRAGIFCNAEVLAFSDKADKKEIDKVIHECEQLGFNTTFIKESNYECIHRRLFESFFNFAMSRERLDNEYKSFCNKQSSSLGSIYSYIESRSSEYETEGGLIEHIVDSLSNNKPCLSILEAAAGYGKTCTVYEIVKVLIRDNTQILPLLIELSKNRNARIFRYVLQDEINAKFSQLSYELVLFEIKNGLIPLVIDGFDELLDTSNNAKLSKYDTDEQSLTMLSTIAELLGDDSQAKIILTSRRSALFTGDIFDEWVGSKLSQKCQVERTQIAVPKIEDWIGHDKYMLLNDENKIKSISNPVMLTFICNYVSVDDLQTGKISWDNLVEKYFELILNREKERQNLFLDYQEQYSIMEKLAAEYAKYDITSEQIEFVQDLLTDILSGNFLEYRERYRNHNLSEEGMLTDEEFVKRLSHNSLLDRPINVNRISFINEFILGMLVGDAICDCYISPEEISEQFLDRVLTAYSIRIEEKRERLFSSIEPVLNNCDCHTRLKAESLLLGRIISTFNNSYFYGISIPCNTSIIGRFLNCQFENVTFNECTIEAEKFEHCMFYNCRFYNVDTVGAFDSDTILTKSVGCEKFVINISNSKTPQYDSFEKIVLEQFWKPGYLSAEPRRTYTALFRGVSKAEYGDIKNAIDTLLKKNIIKELNVCYELNFAAIGEIKDILGRD